MAEAVAPSTCLSTRDFEVPPGESYWHPTSALTITGTAPTFAATSEFHANARELLITYTVTFGHLEDGSSVIDKVIDYRNPWTQDFTWGDKLGANVRTVEAYVVFECTNSRNTCYFTLDSLCLRDTSTTPIPTPSSTNRPSTFPSPTSEETERECIGQPMAFAKSFPLSNYHSDYSASLSFSSSLSSDIFLIKARTPRGPVPRGHVSSIPAGYGGAATWWREHHPKGMERCRAL